MGLMVGCEKAPEVPAAPAVGASDPAAMMKSMEDSMKAGAAKAGEAAAATGDAVKDAAATTTEAAKDAVEATGEAAKDAADAVKDAATPKP